MLGCSSQRLLNNRVDPYGKFFRFARHKRPST
jgi:hypothetical protein